MAIPEFEPAPIPEDLLADNPYHQQGLRRRATPYYVDPNAQVVDNTSQFGRSVRNTAMNVRAGYTEALPGLARQLAGDQEGAQRNYAEFQRQSELASRLGPRIQSMDDINGIGDAALWAMHLGVGTAPDIVTSMTGAGLGATAARGIARRGAEAAARRHVGRAVSEQGMDRAVNRQINDAMVRNTVGAADNRVLQAQFRDAIDDTAAGLVARSPGARRAMDQAARVGSIAGSGAGQYPGMAQDSVEALQQTDRAGAASIAATDTVASIIGGLPVDRLVGRIMGRGLREVPGADEAIAKNLREYLPKALKNVSKEALVQGGAEGVLGVAQAATQLAGHDYVLGQAEMFGPEAMNRYLAELVGGALVGGMMGGAVEAGRMAPEGAGLAFGSPADWAERRAKLTAAIRERLAAAADRARAFHERRNQARYAPGEEMGAGGPGPGTGEPGAPTGGVAGVYRDGMDAVQKAAAAAGRTLRSTYDRFRKNKEADAHETDLDDEASSSADLLDRWAEGFHAPLDPEAQGEGMPQPRRPNVGPQAGLGTPLQRVLMTYMPEDSPIWQDPAAATSVAESLERMLRGEATDADRLAWEVALDNGLPPQVFELWRMAGDQFAEALRTIPLDSDGGRVGAGAFSERMSGPERFVQQGGEEIDTDATAENIEAAQQQVDEDIDNPDARLDEGEAEGYGGYGVGGFDRGSLTDQLLSLRQGVQQLDARIAEARESGQDVRGLVAERRRASAEGVRLARRTREDLLGGPEEHPDFPGGDQPGTVFKENGKAPHEFEEKLAQPGQVQIDGFTLRNGKKMRKALDLGGLALRYRGRYMSGESLVDALHTAFGELLVAGVRPDMSTLKAGDVKNNKGEVLFTLTDNDVAALRNAARQYAMPEAGPIGRGDTTAAEAVRVGRIQENVTAEPRPVIARRGRNKGQVVGEVGGQPRPDSTGFAPEDDATFDERTSFDQIMAGADMDPRTVRQGERELPPQGIAPGSGERTSTTAPVSGVDFRDPYAKAVESAIKSDADAKRRDDEKVAEYERIENDPKVSPQEKKRKRIAYYEVQRKRARSDSMSEDGYTRAQELEGFRIGIAELNRQRDDGTISQRAYAQQMRTLLGDGWKRHTGGLDLEAVNSAESFGDRNKAMEYFNRAKDGEFTSTPRVRELQQDDNELKKRGSTEEPAVLRVKNRVAEALTAARALDNSPEAQRYRELHARYQRGDRMSRDVFAEYRELRAEYGPIEKGEYVNDDTLIETIASIKPIAENNRHPIAQKIRTFVRARRAQEAGQGAERARARTAADKAFAEMTQKQQVRALEQLAYRAVIDNLDAIPADHAIHDAVQRPEESRVDAEGQREQIERAKRAAKQVPKMPPPRDKEAAKAAKVARETTLAEAELADRTPPVRDLGVPSSRTTGDEVQADIEARRPEGDATSPEARQKASEALQRWMGLRDAEAKLRAADGDIIAALRASVDAPETTTAMTDAQRTAYDNKVAEALASAARRLGEGDTLRGEGRTLGEGNEVRGGEIVRAARLRVLKAELADAQQTRERLKDKARMTNAEKKAYAAALETIRYASGRVKYLQGAAQKQGVKRGAFADALIESAVQSALDTHNRLTAEYTANQGELRTPGAVTESTRNRPQKITAVPPEVDESAELGAEELIAHRQQAERAPVPRHAIRNEVVAAEERKAAEAERKAARAERKAARAERKAAEERAKESVARDDGPAAASPESIATGEHVRGLQDAVDRVRASTREVEAIAAEIASLQRQIKTAQDEISAAEHNLAISSPHSTPANATYWTRRHDQYVAHKAALESQLAVLRKKHTAAKTAHTAVKTAEAEKASKAFMSDRNAEEITAHMLAMAARHKWDELQLVSPNDRVRSLLKGTADPDLSVNHAHMAERHGWSVMLDGKIYSGARAAQTFHAVISRISYLKNNNSKKGEHNFLALAEADLRTLRQQIELRAEVERLASTTAASPESIATGKPDLAREQAFANEILQKAGIDTPVEIRSYGDPRRKRKTSDRGDPNSRKIGRYSVNSRGEAVIYLSDALDGPERLEVLSHELGHHMIRTELVRASNGKMTLGDIADMEMTTKDVMVALQAFNPELYAKLKKDYDAWVEANPPGLRTGAEVRASRAAYARANALLRRSKSNKPALARDDVDYLYDMEEWFADNIARALTSTDSPAQGTVAKFFKDIADKLKALYNALFGTPEAKKWAAAPSVDAFVRELFSRERAAVADVLGAEPSTAQVEAAVTTAVATNFILVHDPVVPPRRAENPPPGGTPPDADKGMTPSGPGKNLLHVKGEAIRDLGPKSFQAAARFVRDFFTPDMRRIVEQALNRPAPMKRLREIYKDNPRILKALDSADRGMEAQIAAAYLAWKSGEFVVGPQGRSAFIGADEGLSYIFNVAANGDMAQRIFNDMATGRIERIRQSGKDYDVRAIEARHRGKMQELANSANKIMDAISKPWSKFIDSKMKRAFSSGVPAYRRIAAQLYRPQGTTGADRGMVREEAYELARWTTRARNAMGDLSPLEQQRVLRALQEGKGYTAKIRDNFGPEVTQAQKARAAARSRAMQKASEDLRAMFDDMHAYMKERGVDLGRIENYFPVVMELTTDGQRSRLRALLDQPKYHKRIRELFEKAPAGSETSSAAAREIPPIPSEVREFFNRAARNATPAVAATNDAILATFEGADIRALERHIKAAENRREKYEDGTEDRQDVVDMINLEIRYAKARIKQLEAAGFTRGDSAGGAKPRNKLRRNPHQSDEAAAAEALQGYIDNLVAGASQGTFDAPVGDGAPNFKATNYRLMSFIYELGDDADIKEFAALQSKDMARILERYVYGAVKRAEFAKRFGDDGGKLDTLLTQMEKQGATPEQVQDARDMVDAAIGRYGAEGSPVLSMLSPALAKRLAGPKSRSIIDGMQAYQNARVLPLALLSSLVDPLGIAVRAGGDLTTVWQGFRGGMRLLFRKSGRDEMIALMREVGMPDDADALQTLQMGYGGGDNPTARRVNEFVFKANGLAWLTQRTRGLALQTAHAFLLKHANSKTEASKEYLRELGVNASDIRRLYDHNGKQRVVVLSEAERATASPEALARDDRVRRALLQFTDEAVLRPHSQQTPQWHSDPYMRLVTQYKAFAYAMYDQIWGRIALEWGKGNAAVLLPALAYLPVALMAELLREWIQWGEDGNPHRESWGALEYTQLAATRTGLMSPQMTFIESAHDDMGRGNLPGTSEIGPTGGQARRLLDGRQWSQDFEDALPASSLWKRWINPTEWGQE